MKAIRNPLKTSMLKICAVTFSVLCVALTLLNYFSYRKLLFDQYDAHMKNVLTNTACVIDTDDLAECIRTGEESDKYHDLQRELDMRKDNTDLHYLYIIIPLNTDETDNVQNVIAAMSSKEYAETPEDKVELNSLTGDSYSPQIVEKYLDAYNSGELSYFENITEFGHDYTALMPLYDSSGNKIAALCIDIEMSDIYHQLFDHSLMTVVVTLMAGLLISILFMEWTKRNVLKPIETLEKSVSDYLDKGLDSQDPQSLLFEMPDVHSGNEVESLARKIVLMSEALCVTVSNTLLTEEELAEMSIIAHKDALTQVGNKSAYKNYLDEMQEKVENGDAAFAVVMADINRLKEINDTYGHEKGDIYIRMCCSILCGVYQHSPVFRVGGDEFIIFLTGHDYEQRKELLSKAKERLSQARRAPDVQPWTAASVALGMAVYTPESDTSVQQVVTRADRKMYANKNRMHKARNRSNES